MRVLGVDPGLASVGWGVVSQRSNRLIFEDQGTITTPSKMDLSIRLETIHRGLNQVISRFQPDCMSVETLYFAKNKSSAMAVAHGRGVIALLAGQHGLPFFEFSPNEIKQSIVGTGGADKGQMETMVRLLLGNVGEKISHHAMDALGTAICAIHHHPGGIHA